MGKKVLVVDDTIYMRSLVKDVLNENGNYHIVGEAADGETAIDLAHSLRPDLITLDNVLPDMLGLEVLKVLLKSDLNCKILMVSAVGQESMKAKAIELGAAGYLVKPFTPKSLIEEVEKVFRSSVAA